MREFAEQMQMICSRGSCWLLFALLVGVPLRFYKLSEPQLWLDELLRLVRFSHSSLWESFNDLRQDVAAVPLDYMIQQTVVQYGGFSEFTARFHAAFFGSLSLVAIYWLSKQFLSSRTAGINAVLTAVFPLHIFYSREAANYSLFFLLTLLSFGVLWKALNSRNPSWTIAFSIVSLANLYTNYFALTVLACQVVLVGFSFLAPDFPSRESSARPNRSNLKGLLFSALVALSLFLPWALWTSKSTSATYPSVFSELGLPLRIFREVSGGSYPLSILLVLLVISGLFSLVVDRKRSLVVVLVAWFVLPSVLVLMLDWWRGYFFAIRQILFATPPLLILAAAGIEAFATSTSTRKRPILALLALGLFILLGVGTIALSDKKEQADWKRLDSHLQTEVMGDALISAPNIERVIAFRYPQMMDRKVALNSILDLSGLPDSPEIHLVKSRYATAAQGEQIAEILENGDFQLSFQAPGFEVYVLRRASP
jgi:uncharacterized membrane protein